MPTIATPPRAGLHGLDASDRRRRTRPDDTPSLWLRLRVVAHRYDLTVALSQGADPASSPQLALRAAQLTGVASRRRLAATLTRTMDDAQRPYIPRVGPVPIRRQAVLDAQPAIDQLVAHLRSAEPVTPEGMAMVERLIVDGSWSPLYNAAEPGTLRRLVILATSALKPDAYRMAA